MYLALYKGPPKGLWHKIGHYVTAWWTSSQYSHCELTLGPIRADGFASCVSASWRDGGVRVKDIEVTSGHWDLLDLSVYGYTATALYDDITHWLIENGGAKYDHLGLFFFVVPLRSEHPTRWFCSEACAAILKLPTPWKFSPATLARYFTQGWRP